MISIWAGRSQPHLNWHMHHSNELEVDWSNETHEKYTQKSPTTPRELTEKQNSWAKKHSWEHPLTESNIEAKRNHRTVVPCWALVHVFNHGWPANNQHLMPFIWIYLHLELYNVRFYTTMVASLLGLKGIIEGFHHAMIHWMWQHLQSRKPSRWSWACICCCNDTANHRIAPQETKKNTYILPSLKLTVRPWKYGISKGK